MTTRNDATEHVLDADQSRVRIRTFAEGLFARLAHDLELVARAEGTSDGTSATLRLPLGRIEVAGTLVKDRVDGGALSATDRQDILRKMREDVFHAGTTDELRVEARLDADGEQVKVRIVPPHRPPLERRVAIRIDRGEGAAPIRVHGRCELSLAALGSNVVKGPMNAFRVKDAVEILFELVFRPRDQPA